MNRTRFRKFRSAGDLALNLTLRGFRIAPANRSGPVLDERSIRGTSFFIWRSNAIRLTLRCPFSINPKVIWGQPTAVQLMEEAPAVISGSVLFQEAQGETPGVPRPSHFRLARPYCVGAHKSQQERS
jgi:hypothetical protein